MKDCENSKFRKMRKSHSHIVSFWVFFYASTLREWLLAIISYAQATVDNTTQHKNDSNPDEEGINKIEHHSANRFCCFPISLFSTGWGCEIDQSNIKWK